MIAIALEQGQAVASAKVSFADACSELDDAVSSLTGFDGETVMANADLVTLLLRVSAARRHLKDVERPSSASLPASLR